MFYAEELASVASSLKVKVPDIIVESLFSLNEMLQISEDTKHYPYNKTFEEAKNEPCLILHSSGSTGMIIPALTPYACMLTLSR